MFLKKKGVIFIKKLTITDIARLADVSVTAVSFVINGKPGVSEETRKKVQKIIDENDFRPNLNSKKLLLKKSYNICLMLNSYSSPFDNLFYFEIMRGILNQGMRERYNVIISRPVKNGSELPDLIYSGDADGIIFMQDIEDYLLKKVKASGVPFLVVDSHSVREDVTSINPDYKKAAYDAANHLIENNHKNIAVLTSNVVPDFYNQTLAGFSAAIEESGLSIKQTLYDVNAFDEDAAYRYAKKIFKSKNPPTAILCTVDNFAIGIMRYAKENGISIPDELSIVGIDDILLSRHVEPGLTTVGFNKESMGELAMDMIIKKINGESLENVFIPMELIKRNSVKKL